MGQHFGKLREEDVTDIVIENISSANNENSPELSTSWRCSMCSVNFRKMLCLPSSISLRSVNNPIATDRLNYDVLFHTDLSRNGGMANDLDLDRLNWGNYDLVVIDESHKVNKYYHTDC